MGVYGIITYNNKDFKKPICHIMHIVVLLLLTLNLISKTVCHVRFRFFSVLILWLVKFGHDYEIWKDSSLEQTGFILERSFAGFPQLKKNAAQTLHWHVKWGAQTPPLYTAKFIAQASYCLNCLSLLHLFQCSSAHSYGCFRVLLFHAYIQR